MIFTSNIQKSRVNFITRNLLNRNSFHEILLTEGSHRCSACGVFTKPETPNTGLVCRVHGFRVEGPRDSTLGFRGSKPKPSMLEKMADAAAARKPQTAS